MFVVLDPINDTLTLVCLNNYTKHPLRYRVLPWKQHMLHLRKQIVNSANVQQCCV